MGTGAEFIIPAVIGALGTGAAAYSSYDTARKQDRLAAQGIRDQAAKQRQIDERVNQQVAATAQSSPEDAARKSTDDFLAALRRTRGAASPGGIAGGSARFQEGSDAISDEVQAYGADVAGTLGRINAPALQRQSEAQGFGRLASDVGALAREAAGAQYLNQLRMRGVRPNTGLQLFSDLAGGAASGLAARGGRGSGRGGITPGGTRTDVPVRSPRTRGLA